MLIEARSKLTSWVVSTRRVPMDDPQLIGVVRRNSRSVRVDRTAGSWFTGFQSIFDLGLRHIREGTDHLLFLLTLLLPAPLLVSGSRWTGSAGARQSLLQILKIVTAFTLGHSLNLALATLGFVHVPSRPVEVLIAASSLYQRFMLFVHCFRDERLG
jgi:HupE / UreJ protein